jgi:hypothetical protein
MRSLTGAKEPVDNPVDNVVEKLGITRHLSTGGHRTKHERTTDAARTHREHGGTVPRAAASTTPKTARRPHGDRTMTHDDA